MIRVAQMKDLGYLIKWTRDLKDFVLEETGDIYIKSLIDLEHSELHKFFAEAVLSENSTVFLAVMDETPVGFIHGVVTDPVFKPSIMRAVGRIEACWVVPDFRRQGLARQLINHLEDWFREKSIEYVDLNYLEENKIAKQGWEKMGYSPYRITSRKRLN